jgi:hypothetical protein
MEVIMSTKQAKQTAEQFLRESAKIIGKYGEEPKLSGERYREVLAETQRAFQSLSANKAK